jgi:hypothetical protein
MFKKIVGASVGRKIANTTQSFSASTGAMIGAAAPFVIKRVSFPALVALGVGGYFVKRHLDRKEASAPQAPDVPAKTAAPVASIPQPATA